MDLQDIKALVDLINPEDEEEQGIVPQQYNAGSVLTPGDIGQKQADGKKKEVAKPFTKVQAIGGRQQQQQQPADQQNQQQKKNEEQKKQDQKNMIWTEDEVQEVPIPKNDDRLRPDVDVVLKQNIGTQDVFLGMGDMNPTSSKCQEMVVKIKLPNTSFKEISLDVLEQNVIVQSTKYYVNYTLPYKVNQKEGNAKWVSDKNILEITLPIIRPDLLSGQ